MPATSDFATLPPFFTDENEAVQVAFHNYPQQYETYPSVLSASLVYHQDYLRSLTNHRILNTQLFTHAALLRQLRPLVECQLPRPTDCIHATGASGLTTMMIELQKLQVAMQATSTEMSSAKEDLTPILLDGLTKWMEERSVQGNVVTHHGLKEIIMDCIREALPSRQEPATPVTSNVEASAPTTSAFPKFFWREAYHFVPDTFELPDCVLRNAWTLYCYQRLKPIDTNLPRQRKNLSKFHCAMRFIEEHANKMDGWNSKLTEEEAQLFFTKVEPLLGISDKTAKGRDRRVGEFH